MSNIHVQAFASLARMAERRDTQRGTETPSESPPQRLLCQPPIRIYAETALCTIPYMADEHFRLQSGPAYGSFTAIRPAAFPTE
jgi:hypothetical protein